jgi:citrate lyase subunit beta/citryl-CoA lyase
MLAKAPTLGADEAIVDLEDAVAPENKVAARELAVAAVRRGPLAATTSIRVNARGTEWWEDDLRAAAAARPDVVVLPKVESPEDVAAAAELLPAGIGLEAQIETARGLADADRIAAAGHGLEAFVFGPADLAASLGIPVLTIGDGANDYAFARVVAAARAAGLQAIDGPHARLGDDLGLGSCRRGARSSTATTASGSSIRARSRRCTSSSRRRPPSSSAPSGSWPHRRVRPASRVS